MSPVTVDGRHLAVDGLPWRVRAVTYGSFLARDGDGAPFPAAGQVRRDLENVAAAGLNTVRTYCLPTPDLLDAADELNLRLLVGLHYDDWRMLDGTSAATSRQVLSAGRRSVDEALERLTGRNCVLAVVVGNEVPGDLVRLHGPRRVEAVMADLIARVHDGAPGMLATYASYPTTEYLQVPGQDFACANVFLDDPTTLRSYLRHLMAQVGELPLVVSEVGVDAHAWGEPGQASRLGEQLDVIDEVGCAGAAVFSLTDEWGVGGYPVEAWAFGLQDTTRGDRAAFGVVTGWAKRSLRDLRPSWPSLTVVVCAYQEQERLGRCLDSLAVLDYPGLDVVVVDDGSTDGTVQVAERYPFTLLQLPHGGLSAARNAGTAASSAELVAFLDADATCHPEWPYHLALSFAGDPAVVASGGPNLPVRAAGAIARAVNLSPGNPVEVLVSADRAEHVPGCNSVFRRSALIASGGFLPALTTAGDDVDLCWRLLDSGGVVAFSAAAQVRHERRTSVRTYLRQQRGYGRAERMISGRHPHRFNRWGQATWSASLYGGPLALPRLHPRVVSYGAAGSAPYQPIVGHRGVQWLQTAALLVLPTILLLAGSLVLAATWTPAVILAVLFALALAGYAVAIAAGTEVPRDEPTPRRVRALAVALHLAQPFARAVGGARAHRLAPPLRSQWTGDRMAWVNALHLALTDQHCVVQRSGPHSRHDLGFTIGPLWRCQVATAVRWGNKPVLSSTIRPRSVVALAALLGVLVVADLSSATTVAELVGVLAAAAGAELLVVRSRLRRAVAGTTISTARLEPR